MKIFLYVRISPRDEPVLIHRSRTGATGYIGGDVLASIAGQFPTASITALVRDVSRAKSITDKYPQVQLQQGDLDSAGIIEGIVSETDVVISMCW